MSKTRKKNNKKKIFIIFIIAFVIILLAFIAYFTYDRYYKQDESIPDSDNSLEEDVKINREEVNEYLSEVPFYGVNGYGKDAYQGYKLTKINDIDSSVFLSYASTMLDEDQILSYKEGMPLPDGESENDMKEDSSGYIYFKKDDLTSIINRTYNYEIKDMNSFNSPGNKFLTNNVNNYENSTFTYKDGYFITYGTISKALGLRVSRLTSYNITGDSLIINEKYGVYTCNEESCFIYSSTEPSKNRGLNNNNIIYKCNLSDTCSYKLKDELENNNLLKTYKHTFKLIEGQYYWESSIMID